MTNCLRHGDLTAIRETCAAVEVTIYEVKAGSSHDEAQLRRLERATELLRTHLDATGGSDGRVLRVTPVPVAYETLLSVLPDLIERAKAVGFDWILPHACLLVGAVDYRVWGRGDVAELTENFAKARAEVGWPGEEPETLDWISSLWRMRDRAHSFSSLAPFAIFPLAAEDVANVIAGPIDLFFSLHLPRLEEALSRDRVSVRIARPPESSTLFLEARRGERGVTVPPHLREQMMTELVTPDCIFAAINEILKLNEANPSEAYDSRLVVFADERQVSTFDLSRYMGASLTMIDRHYGHLARDGREHAIRLLDTLNASALKRWTLVDAGWTSNQRSVVQPGNRNSS
jgi:hypothetical protein